MSHHHGKTAGPICPKFGPRDGFLIFFEKFFWGGDGREGVEWSGRDIVGRGRVVKISFNFSKDLGRAG